jgi:hypothetical protein
MEQVGLVHNAATSSTSSCDSSSLLLIPHRRCFVQMLFEQLETWVGLCPATRSLQPNICMPLFRFTMLFEICQQHCHVTSKTVRLCCRGCGA